jgi:hypothetical protein
LPAVDAAPVLAMQEATPEESKQGSHVSGVSGAGQDRSAAACREALGEVGLEESDAAGVGAEVALADA